MSAEYCLIFIKKILSLGLAIHTLEFIALKDSFSSNGIWRWSEIKTEHSFLKRLDFLFIKDLNFSLFLWTRFIASLSFFLFPHFGILVIFLFFSTLALALRFRGSFNGGSDYMALLILLALSVEAVHPTEKIQLGIIWYIALQVSSSYFIAGLVKIKQNAWRNGNALIQFIHSPNYNPPLLIKKILSNKAASFLCSWFVIIFEITFPLAIIGGNQFIFIWLFLGLLFHFVNVLLFGLNRFLIIWVATYPALYYVAVSLFSPN